MMLALDPLRTAPYPNPNDVWVVMRGEGIKTWGFIQSEKKRLYRVGGRNAMTPRGHALVTGFRVCATTTPKEAARADESH